MIKVVAKHIVKEGKVDEFLKLIHELVVDTNENHEGCISYELFQDVQNETFLTMIETWESKEALDKHMETESFKRIVPLCGELMAGPAQLDIYKKVD
ncbi:MAG: putative quinol monooxygenase [Lachnospiraceae bacterium]